MLEDKVKKGESLREELAKVQVENEVRPDLTCNMSHLEWPHSDLHFILYLLLFTLYCLLPIVLHYYFKDLP